MFEYKPTNKIRFVNKPKKETTENVHEQFWVLQQLFEATSYEKADEFGQCRKKIEFIWRDVEKVDL